MHSVDVLENHLRRLRMPAMMENLNLRLREAEEGNLGYLDFLVLLIQDEVDSREANNLSKRLKSGGLSPRMTFESYDYRYNVEALAPSIIRDLATCRFIREKRSLVLCGPPGIGKNPYFSGPGARGLPPGRGCSVYQNAAAAGKSPGSVLSPPGGPALEAGKRCGFTDPG